MTDRFEDLQRFMQRIEISFTTPPSKHETPHSMYSLPSKPILPYTPKFLNPGFVPDNSELPTATSCGNMCRCNCHRKSSFRTPGWMRSSIGSLSVGYSGTKLVGRVSCTEKTCLQRVHSSVKITYQFPQWLLGRSVSFTDMWHPLNGHNINLKTPRVISARSEVFVFAQQGNIEGIQRLFQDQKASPFDVSDSEGRSALHVR